MGSLISPDYLFISWEIIWRELGLGLAIRCEELLRARDCSLVSLWSVVKYTLLSRLHSTSYSRLDSISFWLSRFHQLSRQCILGWGRMLPIRLRNKACLASSMAYGQCGTGDKRGQGRTVPVCAWPWIKTSGYGLHELKAINLSTYVWFINICPELVFT